MYFVVYKMSKYQLERYKDLDSALSRIIELATSGYPEVYLKRRKVRSECLEEL